MLDATGLADLSEETGKLRRVDVVGVLLRAAVERVAQSARPHIVFERLAHKRDRAHEILIGDVFATRNPMLLERVARMDAVQGPAAREGMKKADQVSIGIGI